MITLKQALSMKPEEISEFKQDLNKKIVENKNLKAYIEQCTNSDIEENFNGIPIAIKDNIAVKNMNLTCASGILQGYKSPYNATVIDKMASNGLSVFGRCNMDEFAMGSSTESSFYGKTLNPVNYDFVPGGSSGGSAACVAGNIAIASLGSDTGGSIRQPASYCGCVGLKPTYGTVSRFGLTAFSSSLDQIGPITQNVEDSAILYDIIKGFDKNDSTSANKNQDSISKNLSSSKKFTIAIIDEYLDSVDNDVRKNIQSIIKQLENDGHKIIREKLIDTSYDLASYYIIATAEASTNLARFDGIRYGKSSDATNLKEKYISTRSIGFGEEVKRRILLGTFVLSSGYYDAYYIKAQQLRKKISNQYNEIFKKADLILTPVTPTTAYKFNSRKSGLEMYLDDIFTISVNLAGLPAISVPIEKGDNGMPIGVQLIANKFNEQTLLDGALNIENLFKGDRV